VVLVVPAVLVGLVAAQAARASDRFGPLEVSLGATAALRGETRVETLLGDLVLDRHLGPDVRVVVSELSVEPVLAAAAGEAPVESIRIQIDADRERTERLGPLRLRRDEALVARLLIAVFALSATAATLWAATAGLVLARQGRLRRPVRCAVVTGLAVGVATVGAVVATRTPAGDVRTGWLAYGADRADVLQRLDAFDERYAANGRYVLALLDSIDTRSARPADAAACVVAVSDIHSRNVMPLVAATVRAFPCTVAVVDAGDAVDWGRDFEHDFIERGRRVSYRGLDTSLDDLGVPYLVARGNHDSPRTMDAYRTAGAVVLDGEPVTVGGLRIVGRGRASPADDDVLFTPDGGDRDAFLAAQDRLGRALARDARAADPDVVVVHHPRAAEEVLGGPPAVLTGHTHRQGARQLDDTLHVQLGSIGGAGLRAFDTASRRPIRQEWAVLRFDASCRLLGATLISADSLASGELSARDVAAEPTAGDRPTDRRCGPS
jgi:predicted phosphodiesterase